METALGLSDTLTRFEGSGDETSEEVRGSSRDALRVLFNARLTMIAGQRQAAAVDNARKACPSGLPPQRMARPLAIPVITGEALQDEPMAKEERIVAVGLLTERDLESLGARLNRAYPVYEDTDFTDLLKAIDAADLMHKGRQTRPQH